MTKREQARELKRQGLSVRKIAKRLETPLSTVAMWTKGIGQGNEKVTTDYSTETGTVEVISYVRTLEDALDKAGVDRDIWDVDRWVCNAWEMGSKDDEGNISVTPLWQIKVWLKRKGLHAATLQSIYDAIGKHPARPRRPAPRAAAPKGCLLNLSIPDLHVGKRPISGVYPVESIYEWCIDTILQRVAGVDLAMIHLPIGSDLLNVDNSTETTTKGTPQNQSESFESAAVRAVNLLIATIDRLSEVAPVRISAVRGNHDRDSTFWIGQVLAAWYRNDGRVTVKAPGPGKRVYLRFGSTLILTYHGDCVKPDHLESLMIRERPKDFAECTYREAHAGHLHKSARKRLFAQDTYGTVLFRQLPSLSPTDQWHDDNGYVGSPRFAEAQVYDPQMGPILTAEARPPSEMYT
jgi:hypothetical protein